MENIIRNEINNAVGNIVKVYDKKLKELQTLQNVQTENKTLYDDLLTCEKKIKELETELNKYKSAKSDIPDNMIMIPADIVYTTVQSILYAESLGAIDKISDKLLPYAMESRKDKINNEKGTSEKIKQEKPVDNPSERLEKILNNSGLGEGEIDLLNFLFSTLLKDHK